MKWCACAVDRALPRSRDLVVLIGGRQNALSLGGRGGSRPNRYMKTDVQRLQRAPIQTTDGMRFFREELQGGMWLEERLRRLAGSCVPRQRD